MLRSQSARAMANATEHNRSLIMRYTVGLLLQTTALHNSFEVLLWPTNKSKYNLIKLIFLNL